MAGIHLHVHVTTGARGVVSGPQTHWGLSLYYSSDLLSRDKRENCGRFSPSWLGVLPAVVSALVASSGAYMQRTKWFSKETNHKRCCVVLVTIQWLSGNQYGGLWYPQSPVKRGCDEGALQPNRGWVGCAWEDLEHTHWVGMGPMCRGG